MRQQDDAALDGVWTRLGVGGGEGRGETNDHVPSRNALSSRRGRAHAVRAPRLVLLWLGSHG